jgi:hypothetical protein
VTEIVVHIPDIGRLVSGAIGAATSLAAIVVWLRWRAVTRREREANETRLWMEHHRRVLELHMRGTKTLLSIDPADRVRIQKVRRSLKLMLHELDHDFVVRLAQDTEPPGLALARFVRVSWLSPASKRHYLEAIADTQRDYYEEMKCPRIKEMQFLKHEIRWLFVRVSFKLVLESVKTALGIYKVIKFFVS